MKRATCTYHCGGCDSHFSSLVAFDRHRKGTAHGRRCEEPADVPGLVPKTTGGVCRLGGRERWEGVTVWQTAEAAPAGPYPVRRAA